MKSTIFGICITLSAVLLLESVGTICLAQEQPRKFDEFGNVTCEDELARLDNFAIEFQNNEDAQGCLNGSHREAVNVALLKTYFNVRL